MELAQKEFKSSVGSLYLVASAKSIHGIFWREQKSPAVSVNPGPSSLLDLAESQLEEYLLGKRRVFDLPIEPQGSEFQTRVWNELSKIPYGETRSYRDIAKAVGSEKAYRAVGTANGQNPISIVVPCHRVIASDQSLAGYAGGLNAKAKLLQLEGAFFRA